MDELYQNLVRLSPKEQVPFRCIGCGECCKHVHTAWQRNCRSHPRNCLRDIARLISDMTPAYLLSD